MAKKKTKKPQVASVNLEEPVASAQAAGLHYVADTQPGIRRKRAGRGFQYIGPDGQTIRDAKTLRRVQALRIPPAWTDVWICPRPDGHLQATGRDSKNRKQYRYHERWREVRDGTKYNRMIAFGEALPRLRARVERDLASAGLPRRKVLATVVRLLETTLIRIGNEAYAKENGSFGLSTMRDRHVKVAGAQLRFEFRGKSGKNHTVSLTDRRLANIVKRCQDVPGYELFQYLDEVGQRHTIDSADVNAYLKDASGEAFTAKDVRTWAGTVMAACALWQCEAFGSDTQAKRNVAQAIDIVAQRLGNTRTICKKCYVHPEVIDAYLDKTLFAMREPRMDQDRVTSNTDLHPEEAVVLAFLKRQREQQSTSRKAG
jgi:DNA topoisomerase-1